MTDSAAARRLANFMARYTPEVQLIAEESLSRMRELLPGAVQMVYDNYNALVIGFGASERASEAIVSLALYPRWVNLFFLHGAGLPDPERLLKGKGSQASASKTVRSSTNRPCEHSSVTPSSAPRGRLNRTLSAAW